MKKKTVQIIVFLSTLSLVGILVMQVVWMRQAHLMNTVQFDQKVGMALRNVVEEIYIYNNDSTSRIQPVKQVRPDYFVVEVNDTLIPYLLRSLLEFEFDYASIFTNYEYGIYSCYARSVINRCEVTVEDEKSTFVDADPDFAPYKDEGVNGDSNHFWVYFPERESYIFSQMTEWLSLSIFLVIVIAYSFSYSIFSILKQKKLSKVKSDFINNMTHEFKTPISTINVSSEVLMNPDISKNPKRLREYANIIYDENNRLKTQVERVLQMAVLEKGDFQLKKSSTDMHGLIKEVATKFELEIKNRNGSLNLMLSAESFNVKVDVVHITNVLSNLLDNAIKYSPESLEIAITTGVRKDGLVIVIADKGLGLSTEEQKHVFDQFYRVQTGDIHDVKGFGLGLNYVNIMVKAHGGRIDVQSEKGRGSTFELWLPFTD